MYLILLLACLAFILSLALTPVCRNVFGRLGIVDHPDSDRKLHRVPVPRLGGIALALSYTLTFALQRCLPDSGAHALSDPVALARQLFPAVVLVFFTGLIDDLLGLSPWQKLSGQLLAAISAFYAGVQIHGIAGHPLAAYLSLPLTIGWILLATNAFNLIDGMDGLATGIGLFATITMLVAALLHGNVELALATAPLAGGLLGFLRYNFRPASIFLGDCGSLLIGFLLSCYGIVWSHKSATLVAMCAPIVALSIPLLDTGLAIIRRYLRGRPIFAGDREHIHHRLLERGMSPRTAVFVLYAASAVAAAFSLIQSLATTWVAAAIVVVFLFAVYVAVTRLGYVELKMAGHLIVSAASRENLNSHLALHQFGLKLFTAATPEQCWDVIRATYREFGFDAVRFRIAGKSYEDHTAGSKRGAEVIVRISLSRSDDITLSRTAAASLPAVSSLLLEMITARLPAKIASFQRTPVFVPLQAQQPSRKLTTALAGMNQ